jgi:hypothetical protein
MNLKIYPCTAVLASPTIPLQNSAAKFFVCFFIEDHQSPRQKSAAPRVEKRVAITVSGIGAFQQPLINSHDKCEQPWMQVQTIETFRAEFSSRFVSGASGVSSKAALGNDTKRETSETGEPDGSRQKWGI